MILHAVNLSPLGYLWSRQAGVSGHLSLNFMYGWGEELMGESVLGFHNGTATFSLVLTLINLILRSNAEFPFLQQQGRDAILPCTV